MVDRFAVLLLCLLATTPAAADPTSAKPDYNRDVRPILSEHCFECHGPGTQKAGVRLDARKLALKRDAVVPGEPTDSGVIDRVSEPDDEYRMPPAKAGRRLTPAEVATLSAWIEHGAEYAPHWAFVPPIRAQVPRSEWRVSGAIDGFVHAKLREAGLTPSPEADRRTLIRRVTLDLIGLLPTPAEVDAFVTDKSPDAYEKVVDRLLASPHYGERQARHWLDLARYADSNGFTVDGARSIWPYRDWVINAYNADLPFDEFTVHQLAGDLLPDATKDQQIATGFHRNTPFNQEGGVDQEQFRVERTIDRANTTGAVWLGLTVGCAQCHDHKFDPVSQADYYSLYAFFDNAEEPNYTVGGRPDLDKKLKELDAKRKELAKAKKKDELKKIDGEIRKVRGQIPTTLVMRERKTPRETHVLLRGDFLDPGAVVTPQYPVALVPGPAPHPTPDAGPTFKNRLDLARWLVSDENPLTARVTVNREWQKFFGTGIVGTENDFGMQGDLPTHPALLDWLAVDFRESGWSIKGLHKQIVTSATYTQSSHARDDLTQADPYNKWLGKQNRLRVEAEVIRDAALTASGMLTPTVGGPGVYPPLPAEVFSFTQSRKAWPESQGPARFRRGMYTYIWRQSQHHLLTTFDAADAQTTCTQRNRSNTPLQALHLANDPAFLEFYAGLGERLEKDGPKDDAEKVDMAFGLCFGREPTSDERDRVLAFLNEQRKADPKTAWDQVARVLMNLDEFITRE